MPVNLVNEQTFRQFLTLLSYKDEDIPVLTPDNLRDKQFVSVRQDDVIRAMIGQWIKDNVRKYLLADETARFLSKITSVTEESPKWLKKALATGENVYEFNPDKIPDSFYSDIREIKDYLYDKGVQYIKKMLSHTNPTFNLHALKSLPAISGFQKALEESHQWHSKMVENTKFQTIKQSGIGCLIMNLDNGFSVVQLLTPEELDFESQAMGHCVGKGSYDSGVKSGFIKIYSIRDKNIKPHVTLEIRENAVCQCKGKGNKEPAKKYLPLIQKFIKEFDFEIDQDMKNIGLIKQEGEYLSLFDLPEGFVFNRPYLDLSEIDLERANLNIVVEELNLSKSFNFPQKMDFSDIDIVNLEAVDFQKVTEIKWPKKKLNLSKTKNLPSKLNLSHLQDVDLSYVDFQGVEEIIWPKNKLRLTGAKNIQKKLDFSAVDEVDLGCFDFQGVEEIIWPKNKISWVHAKNIPCTLDLSTLREANLNLCDLSNLEKVKWPIEIVYLNKAVFSKQLDLSGTGTAHLGGCDLSEIEEIKWPRTALSLNGVKLLKMDILNFSNLSEVDLSRCDLSKIKEIKWPMNKVRLHLTSFFPPVLDFSLTKEVDLIGSDLSGVEKIICPSEKLNLSNIFKFSKMLNFNQTKEIDFSWSNLSDVEQITFAAPIEKVILTSATNLPKILDFSKVQTVDLSWCNFAGVEKVIWPKNVIGLEKARNISNSVMVSYQKNKEKKSVVTKQQSTVQQKTHIL